MVSGSFRPAEMALEPYPTDPGRLSHGAEINAAMLWHRDNGELGAVWEMTPGVLDDVDGDESFVILSGKARIDFPDGRVLDLGPSDAAVLSKGDPCRWTTLETVRKVVVFRLA